MFESSDTPFLELRGTAAHDSMATQNYGDVVYVGGNSGGYVKVIVEDRDDRVYKEYSLVTTYYSPDLNWEALSVSTSGESIMKMGFFPKDWKVEDFVQGRKIAFLDILKGFCRVKKFLCSDEEHKLMCAATWRVEEVMAREGIAEGIKVDTDVIFGNDENHEEYCKDWCLKLKEESISKKPLKRKGQDGEGSSNPAPKKPRADPKDKGPAAPKEPKKPKEPRKPKEPKEPKKPKEAKKTADQEKNEALNLTAEQCDLSLDPTPDLKGAKAKKPKEDLVEKGRLEMVKMQQYYTFGPTVEFDIPVSSIHCPPATLCYRKLSTQHVKEILHSMKTVQGMPPMTADLVPYNIKTQRLVEFNNTPAELAVFKKMVAARTLDFVAISGQHSSEAAKLLISEAVEDAKLRDQAEKLKFRKARILSSKTPVETLATHSSMANEINATMTFTSNFLDSVQHARKQYIMLRSPPIPSRVTRVDPAFRVCIFPYVSLFQN